MTSVAGHTGAQTRNHVELSFEQTVPRDLAHRRALAEVFITDSARVNDDEFLVAMQTPRAHSLWSDRLFPYHDPLITVEAARQATFVGIHRYLAVPLGLPGSLQQIEFHVEDLESYRDREDAPLEAVFRAHVFDRQKRGDDLLAVSVAGELTIDNKHAMTLSGNVVIFPRRDYEVLRAHIRARKQSAPAELHGPLQPLDPEQVGRRDCRNVVIGEPSRVQAGELEHHYPLIVDEKHPIFFDHPQDHVPGPLILEAYRQAAITTAHRTGALSSPVAVVTGCRAAFVDYGEPEAPLECTASVRAVSNGGPVVVDVSVHQHAKQIASGRVEMVASHDH